MTSFVPTSDDRFSFGLWTVGWRGIDVFGGPVRAPLDPVEAVERLAELGAAAVTFHDDDLFAFGSTEAERQSQIDRLKGALAAGMAASAESAAQIDAVTIETARSSLCDFR